MNKMNVYQIADGRYALGWRNEYAAAVVERTTARPGRPVYRGVRGRRPLIDKRFKRVQVSEQCARELIRVARAAGWN